MEQTQNTALLVMDMQQAMVGMLPEATNITANVAKAIAHARHKHIPVMYVTITFRPGAPELSGNNKYFPAGGKALYAGMDMTAFGKIHEAVAPREGDVIITKRRISAFSGSDLEILLRAHGVQHLVLTGIATSGVVLSTVREAADKDYQLTVLKDCCADRDEEVHHLLTTKVFARQADVLTVEEWIAQ